MRDDKDWLGQGAKVHEGTSKWFCSNKESKLTGVERGSVLSFRTILNMS
jgi:hypothetical protein